jgi:hypothetical protein
MNSELYVAQHHAARAAGGTATKQLIGYFTSFEDARKALDERYEEGCWQGISNEATHERWWRDGDDRAWVGPRRVRRT